MGKQASPAAATPESKTPDPVAEPAAAGGQPVAEPAAEAKPAKAEKTYSKADLDAAAKKAADEARAKWDAEKDLSESEKLKKDNEELRSSIRLRDARDEVQAQFEQAGNKSPALAFEAIKANLKFDDAGKLLNGKDLIESFKASHPEQFGEEKPAAGIDGGAGRETKGGTLSKEKLAAMTPDEINRLDWAEVSKVMAAK